MFNEWILTIREWIQVRKDRRKTRKILDDAANLIRGGWIQLKSSNPEQTHYCAVGAIGAASRRIDNDFLSFLANETSAMSALDALNRVVGQGGIITFNDAPGRTKEEVLEVFKKARETV